MTKLVGIWHLVKTFAKNDAGEPMHPPYGEKPRGLLVFYADGRMMSVLCDSRPELPPDETIREYNSYCGNYRFDGKTLVTQVDASGTPERIGSEQIRFVSFVDGRMVLRQKPRPWNGVMQHRELHWERISDAPPIERAG